MSDNVDVFVDLQSALHYTKLNSVNVGAEQDGCGDLVSCEACHWTSRIATCKIAFSGHKYNRESLKVISCVMLLVTCKLVIFDMTSMPGRVSTYLHVYCAKVFLFCNP